MKKIKIRQHMLVKLIRKSNTERFSGWHWNSGAPVCCAPTVPPRSWGPVRCQHSAAQHSGERNHIFLLLYPVSTCVSVIAFNCSRVRDFLCCTCSTASDYNIDMRGHKRECSSACMSFLEKKGIIITTTKKHLGSRHSPLLPTEWLHALYLGRVPQKLTY